MQRQVKQTFSTMIPALKSVAILLVMALALSSCSKDEVEALEEGPVAPGFTLKSTTGADVSLSNFKNKVVVLFFFGNNCPSCKAAGPNVESMLVTPYASRTDYAILGLDQWDGNAASVIAFKSVTNVSFPLLLNASSVAAAYRTTYDRIVIIDKAGTIAFKGNQTVSSDMAAVKAKVNELLAQ
jgi:peroxiredoxin